MIAETRTPATPQRRGIAWTVRELQGPAPGYAKLGLAVYPLCCVGIALYSAALEREGSDLWYVLYFIISPALAFAFIPIVNLLRRRCQLRYGTVLPTAGPTSWASWIVPAAIFLGFIGSSFIGEALGFRRPFVGDVLIVALYAWVYWPGPGSHRLPSFFGLPWLGAFSMSMVQEPTGWRITLFLLLSLTFLLQGWRAESELARILPPLNRDEEDLPGTSPQPSEGNHP